MPKIFFAIGSANISGGTIVIFNHALCLKKMGYDVLVGVMNYSEYVSLSRSKNVWHPGLKDLLFCDIESVQDDIFDLAIYTWWRTVYYLPNINSKRVCYFVQSIESRFYDESDVSLIRLVNGTYSIPMPVITEALWIQKYLFQRYNSSPLLVKNGVDKKIFCQTGPVWPRSRSGVLRILIEGPLGVPFKNTERAIYLASKVYGIEIWLLTSTDIKSFENVDRVFSRLAVSEVSKVYRSCDAILKLSYVEGMFGPPLEMFHCGGTCIVYDVTGHDEYIVDGKNGIVVKTDDEPAVLEALKRLRDDSDYLNALKYEAHRTACQWPSWGVSSSGFHSAVKSILSVKEDGPSISLISRKVQSMFDEYVVAERYIRKGASHVIHAWIQGFAKIFRKYYILYFVYCKLSKFVRFLRGVG